MSVTLSVTISDAEYRRLATLAETKQVPARTIAATIISRTINPPEPVAPVEVMHTPGKKLASQHIARIAELNRAKLNDIEISERTGINRETVRRYRVRMGLPRHGVRSRRIRDEEERARRTAA